MPNLKDVHVSRPLTELAIGTSVQGLIAPQLVPSLTVSKSNDKYFVFDGSKRAYAADNDLRAPAAEAQEVDFDDTTEEYQTSGHALSAVIPLEELADADNPPLDPMVLKTYFLVSKLLVSQEIDCKTILDAALTGDQTSTPTKNWSDYTDGDPIADIKTAITQIEDQTGFTPNTIAMDSKVWRAVRDHPDVLQRVIYGGDNGSPSEVMPNAFGALFGFDRVIIGNAQKNTAVKGQTADLARIWGSDVYITYQPLAPVINQPAFAYRFTWDAFMGGADSDGWLVESWYEATRKAWKVQVEKHYAHKVTMAGAGYRIQSIL